MVGLRTAERERVVGLREQELFVTESAVGLREQELFVTAERENGRPACVAGAVCDQRD